MLTYQITATSDSLGKSQALANKTVLPFDASNGRDSLLPNPAELLLTALAACILKNIERYSIKLHIPYESARISVNGTRSDIPPSMQEITYKVEIVSRAEERKINLLHKNVIKFGTISNTLAQSCRLNGEFIKVKP